MANTTPPLDEAVELSATILADLELGKLTNHQILLKCRRLARLVEDDSWRKWLELELHGYNVVHDGMTTDDVLQFFILFGRELDAEKHTGYVHPLGTLEQEVSTATLELESCRVPTSIHASDVNSFVPDWRVARSNPF